MAESEWQYASWVSLIGKWAWIIGLLNRIFGIIFNIYFLWGIYVLYRLFYFSLFIPYIYNMILCIIGITIALLIIRPKFSIPCGEKDLYALHRWGLNLGNVNIPRMLIWGFLLFFFGWYGWGGLAVLIPALIIIFADPRGFKWFKKAQPR